jgi:hypothetical protein
MTKPKARKAFYHKSHLFLHEGEWYRYEGDWLYKYVWTPWSGVETSRLLSRLKVEHPEMLRLKPREGSK